MSAEPISTTAGERQGPLADLCVLVTRAAHQAAALVGPLESLGAQVIVAPAIETVDPADWTPADAAIDEIAAYDWIVLTSANAVDRFLARLSSRGKGAGALAHARVAVVGPATAGRLQEAGVEVALMPTDFRAEGLVEEFKAAGAGPGWRVLVPRAEKAREILPEALREAGVRVDVVPVYRTVPAVPDPAVIERLRAGEVDVVTFTSPSTARHFIAWLESAGLDARAVMDRIAAASIGPVTTEALVARGYRVPIEAEPSTMTGLVDAISASGTALRG